MKKVGYTDAIETRILFRCPDCGTEFIAPRCQATTSDKRGRSPHRCLNAAMATPAFCARHAFWTVQRGARV